MGVSMAIRINQKARPFIEAGIDGGQLRIERDTLGEPFREGVRIDVEDAGGAFVTVMLDAAGAKKVAQVIADHLGMQLQQNPAASRPS